MKIIFKDLRVKHEQELTGDFTVRIHDNMVDISENVEGEEISVCIQYKVPGDSDCIFGHFMINFSTGDRYCIEIK